jgi:hypothetical protein
MGYIQARDIDGVINRFDRMNTPYFKITYGAKNVKSIEQKESDDIEESRNLLAEWLKDAHKYNDTTPYNIVFYYAVSDNGQLKDDEIKGTYTFKIGQHTEETSNNYYNKIAGNSEIAEIKKMIAGLYEEEEEVIDEAKELALIEQNRPLYEQVIGAIMVEFKKDPVNTIKIGKETLKGFVGFVKECFSNEIKSEMATIGNVTAQTYTEKDWEELNKAIDHLIKSGMQIADFKKLVSIAADKPTTFNMYLTMLRS